MPFQKTRVLFLGKETGLCNTFYADEAGLCTPAAACRARGRREREVRPGWVAACTCLSGWRGENFS